jgi:hypothetical protein
VASYARVTSCAAHVSPPAYRRLSLVQLCERIASSGDRAALGELHDRRRVFWASDGRRMRLAEYVYWLRNRAWARDWCGRDEVALDLAYDLTLDKFCNVPREDGDPQDGANVGAFPLKRNGADCRYYYVAYCEHMRREMAGKAITSAIEREQLAARRLQAFVYRHFGLSCLESVRRSQRLVKRYAWERNGTTTYLWFPTEMTGRQIAAWLRANVVDTDPSQPGERERIQELIDARVFKPALVSLEERDQGAAVQGSADAVLPWSLLHGMSVDGLAEQIAQEKADNLCEQRPAIRALGAAALRQMIRRIFRAIDAGAYKDGSLAAEFGLNKATFSRFAGSRWHRGAADSRGPTVPDLWRNTAHTLARHPAFVAAAREADVWQSVSAILPDARGKRTHE